jgi:hypothetical protein
MVAQCDGNDAATVQDDGGHGDEDGGAAPLFLMITSVQDFCALQTPHYMYPGKM